MRAYKWLGVSLAILVDINKGYKIAYRGLKREGGIEVQNEERKSPPPLKTNFAIQEIRQMQLDVGFADKSPGGSPRSKSTIPKPTINKSTLVAVGESARGRELGVKVKEFREDRGPHQRRPVTPNGFEDITPVTKGEWCFLIVGDGWS
jgi:hypothetical protein